MLSMPGYSSLDMPITPVPTIAYLPPQKATNLATVASWMLYLFNPQVAPTLESRLSASEWPNCQRQGECDVKSATLAACVGLSSGHAGLAAAGLRKSTERGNAMCRPWQSHPLTDVFFCRLSAHKCRVTLDCI